MAVAFAIVSGVAAPVPADEEQNRDQERNRTERPANTRGEAKPNSTTQRKAEPGGPHRLLPGNPSGAPSGPRTPGMPSRTMSPPGAGPAGLNGSRFQSGQGPQRSSTFAPPRSFVARPTPLGGAEMHTASGAVIRTRPSGARSDIYDPTRGMAIHNGLNGGRIIDVERPDHSRIVAQASGRGFVQHPYLFQGREFAQRTYFDHGQISQRFYRPYRYHGLVLQVYAPARYFPVGFYRWAYRPWRAPAPYAWGWARAPWYGYYGSYFAPYPVYASAAYWLTDYLISTSLQAAYNAQAANAPPPANALPPSNAPPPAVAAAGTPALSPEVKQMVADEVQRDMQQEAAQAGANDAAPADAQSPAPAAPAMGIAQRLSDNAPHVFMAGANIDLVDEAGKECAIGPGDVLMVSTAPLPAATTADATILSSKGTMECPASAMVKISLTDLQEMQNHVRETLDDGMSQLQAQQGQGGLPAAPATATGEPTLAAFATGAPAPDAMAGTEIAEQSQAADQAEKDIGGDAPAAPSAPHAASRPSTTFLSEPLDAVVAYVDPDLNITLQDGPARDVQ
jgi:hypothetical protein